jgi:flagellar motor protein MotB
MRNLILGISFSCLALSGLITFKALNLPEKNPRDSASQPSIETHEYSQITKHTVPDPNKEQDRKSNVNQTVQNTTSQLEQKRVDKIDDSQMHIQTLENTVKQLEQKLADKNKASQTYTQPAKNTTTQRKDTPASHKNTSQNILGIGKPENTPRNILGVDKPENTEKSLGLLLFSVNFNPGKFVIDDDTKKLIQKSTQYVLSLPPNYRLIVEGHTDSLPIKTEIEKKYLYKGNRKLSRYRAKTIADMFEKEGVPSNRISAIGYGAKRPMTSNNTVEGRAKNRRVVVRLISEEKER